MHKWMRPLIALVILFVSMLLLSAIIDNLTPYLAIPSSKEKSSSKRRMYFTESKRLTPPNQMSVEPGRLIFVVSPADPMLYWRTSTADYYDGLGWYRTTRQNITDGFPGIQGDNATHVFTVELNTTEKETSLPVPPTQTDLTEPVLSPSIEHEYYSDEIGDIYGMRILGLSHEVTIVYQAGWYYTEIDKWRVSLKSIPQEIRDVYLQLPSLPVEVVQLAEELKRPNMNVVDQILSDVAYFLTNFEYDLNYYRGLTRRVITRDWVLSYMQWRKGVCLDAATALAVILRCQGIPSRISLGYKPTRIQGDKVFYYSNSSHAETEAYLPPYGWVRFDATPFSPLDFPQDFGVLRPEKGLSLNVSPVEAEGCPGESVFFHLMINNSRGINDYFEISMHIIDGWNGEITPESLSIGAFETRDALIEVRIPENATHGQANTVTVTATSTYNPVVNISNTTIVRVGDVKRLSTVTVITYINNSVFRGDNFYVEGTVSTVNHQPVHDVPVLILLKENKEANGIVCGNGFSQNGVFHIEGQVPLDTKLGDHLVVAVSLGNNGYAPSSSDPYIKVVARTYIQLDICLDGVHVTRPFLVEDHVLISGILRLDNGTRVSDAALELEVLTPTSPRMRRNKIIAKNGFFTSKFMFWASGIYDLNVTFLGKKHIAGSYSYKKIEVGLPLVQDLTDGYCVRGEVLNISGNVSSNDSGIPEEPTTISFDGDVLATVKTRLDGTFSYSWKVNSKVQPGWHTLAYTLQKRNGLSLMHYVKVMVKAQVAIDVPEKVTGGVPFTCAVSLRDDHELPIDGEEISIGNYGLSSKTDELGNVEFLLDTQPLWWGNLNLSVTFKGSEEYVPSTRFVIVTIQPRFAYFFFVFMSSALFILGLTTDRGKFRRFFLKEKSLEAQLEKTSMPPRKETSITKVGKARAVKINFIDIKAPFPNVWGVNEKLQIECTLDRNTRAQDRNEIELFVDDKRIGKERLSKNGTATFSHVFNEKGEHEVLAVLVRKSRQRSMKMKKRLRIVDYREEIIRLYKRFLQHLVGQDVDLKDGMTAREVEHLLSVSDFDLRSLHKVIDCFERAEYSDHKVYRVNYKKMYLSLKEMIVNVD